MITVAKTTAAFILRLAEANPDLTVEPNLIAWSSALPERDIRAEYLTFDRRCRTNGYIPD